MERKSVTAFVLGLITSIFSIIWGFIMAIGGDIVSSVTDGGMGATVTVLAWLCFIGGILGIVASCQCFKRARLGGIMLSVATILCGSLLVYLLVKTLKATNNIGISFFFMLYMIPVCLFVAADVCAFLAKPQKNQDAETTPKVE